VLAKNSPRDRITDSALYQGLTARELAIIFHLKPDTVKARIGALKASGERYGYPLYNIRDAAPFLVPPPADMVSHVMRLNHTDLPKILSKEYWFGQNARLKYEEASGNLWKTQDVVEYFADSFKDIRMAILLLLDRVERETAFSDRQRQALQAIIDSTLEDIRGRLEKTFQGRQHSANGRPGPDLPAERTLEERAAGL